MKTKWLIGTCGVAVIAGIAAMEALHLATHGHFAPYGWHVDVLSERVNCGLPCVEHFQHYAVVTNFGLFPRRVQACRIPDYVPPLIPKELQPYETQYFPFHLESADRQTGAWKRVRPDLTVECNASREESHTIWPLQSFKTMPSVAAALSGVRNGSWLRFVIFLSFADSPGRQRIVSSPFQYTVGLKVIDTSLCELARQPERFNGKLVQFRAVVVEDFEKSVVLDDSCSANVHLETLDFIECLNKNGGHELLTPWPDEAKSPVTIIGRFEHIENRAPGGRNRTGFGHMGQWDSQVILQSISEAYTEPLHSIPSEAQR